MGVKDQGLQEYLKDNERFADFVNGTLFAGKQIVDPRYLKEVQRKKRVSYKQSISVINIQKKMVLKISAKKRLLWKKVSFKQMILQGKIQNLCIWKESEIFCACTISQDASFYWLAKLNPVQTMKCQ